MDIPKQTPKSTSTPDPGLDPNVRRMKGYADLAAPGAVTPGGGVGLKDVLALISAPAVRYQFQRLGIILFGIVVFVALSLVGYWFSDVFAVSVNHGVRQFEGEFPIRVEIRNVATLPGSPPSLIATSWPEHGDGPVEILRFPVFREGKLFELYPEYVSEQVAFVIIDSLYAVTTNEGHSWEVVRIRETVSGEKAPSALMIDGVILDEYGSGMLFPAGVADVRLSWVTDDFGLTWTAPQIPGANSGDDSLILSD